MVEFLSNISIAAHRRAVQVAALIGLHASWGPEAKWLCNPVLTCHSCPLAFFACPIGVFVHYSGHHIFPFLAVGMVLILGVLIGRLLCGWVCPFGFLQDMLHKIPSPKFTLPRWTRFGKYIILIVMVFMIPFLLGAETAWSFCRFCPASAIEVTIPNLGSVDDIDTMTGIKLGILAGIVILAIMSSRAFCKVFCPIGAMLAPLNYISFWKIRVPTENCIACRKCDKGCPMGIEPAKRIKSGVAANRDAECIVCHECQVECPRPKTTVRADRTE
jgi:ferredoxin-type protein NapH